MKLRTLVWKTGVLTITQHPLTKNLLFHGCLVVKTTIDEATFGSEELARKLPKADFQSYDL